jgi:alkaline phosphatase D
MRVGRREILRRGTALGAAALLPACEPAAPPPPSGRFAWGVASGDPTTRSVIVWTRLAVSAPEELELEVFEDPGASVRVVHELALAEPERDGCVKVDVEGLAPGRAYYYRFRAADGTSALGRTRTLPEGPLAHARLGVVTCSNFAFGHFHGYLRLAARNDLGLVVHLGDTIYEYADGAYGELRPLDPPHETVTLDDYRKRYARYRLDPDLQEMTRQHPLLPVWDDHEFANNAHRAGSLTHDPSTQGSWEARVLAARRAFFEWMPTRDEQGVHRACSFGDLARLVLLDTRMDGRDPPPIDETDLLDADRRILGAEQERWVLDELDRGSARWTLIGNQVVLSRFPALGNLDAWDGFPSQQARLLAGIERASRPVVVLTGDTHSSLAFDLPGVGYDARAQSPSIGVEWGTPALASPHVTGEESRARERALLGATPHLRWTEQEAKGYLLLDLTPERARAEWWFVEDATRPDGDAERLARAFETTPTDRASREASLEPSLPAADAPPRAP